LLFSFNESKVSFFGVHLAFTPGRVGATEQIRPTSHTADLISQDMTVHFTVFPTHHFKKKKKKKSTENATIPLVLAVLAGTALLSNVGPWLC